jgi:hypothetical protein
VLSSNEFVSGPGAAAIAASTPFASCIPAVKAASVTSSRFELCGFGTDIRGRYGDRSVRVGMPAGSLTLYCGSFPGVVESIERGLLGLQADVRIVLEHPPREVAGNRFDHVIRLAGLEEPGDNGVP